MKDTLTVYLLERSELKKIKYSESILSERRRAQLVRLKNTDAKELGLCAELLLIFAVKKFAGAAENARSFESSPGDGQKLSFEDSSPQLAPNDIALPLDIDETDKGKTFFGKSSPLYGKVFFNLSHSHEWAAALVSNEPVGVDIEHIKAKDAPHPEKILHPEEFAKYKAICGPEAQKSFFYECWVRKESYLKALGIGITLRSSAFMIEDGGHIKFEAGKAYPKMFTHTFAPCEITAPEGASALLEDVRANYRIAACSKVEALGYEARIITAVDVNKIL